MPWKECSRIQVCYEWNKRTRKVGIFNMTSITSDNSSRVLSDRLRPRKKTSEIATREYPKSVSTRCIRWYNYHSRTPLKTKEIPH